LPVLAQTETSALALGVATIADDDLAMASSEEQVTEAHPS
jgi:hypothetical protein